jgi:hypothetical protein
MANFPQPVIDDIAIATDIFLDLDEQSNNNILNGCTTCEVKDYHCLFRILRDLQYKIDSDKFDEVAVKLYYKMMLIIGGSSYSPTAGFVFFGIAASNAVLTLEQILAGSSMPYTFGEQVIVPFGNDEYLFNWFAVPIIQPVFNHYQNINVPIDQGSIGTPSDLFNAPVIVTGYNLYMGNFTVPITDPLLLTTI